jgi:hypothetical protein
MSADHQAETKPAPDEGILAPDDIDLQLPPIDERSLVTFAVFAYNQEKYIREAVEGGLCPNLSAPRDSPVGQLQCAT